MQGKKPFAYILLMKKILLLVYMCSLILCSCGGRNESLSDRASGNLEEYESEYVNPVEQARPTIMVIPSDILLKRYNALKTERIQGVSTNIYDYNKYLLDNNDNKALLSMISANFVNQNYPIQDLEQALKQLQNRAAMDYVDNIGKDAKTELLTAAQPDLIVELDYARNMNMRGDPNLSYNYTINVIDPYTNNVIATATQSGLKGENVKEAVQGVLNTDLQRINGAIIKSYDDILVRGRNITIRINLASDCPFNLDSRSIAGETYSDWIVDYIKTHTVKGAYKLQLNTAKELYFVNCRIKLLNPDDTQYGVYDWARDMTNSLYKNLGVVSSNKAQGLGEVVITLNGLKP